MKNKTKARIIYIVVALFIILIGVIIWSGTRKNNNGQIDKKIEENVDGEYNKIDFDDLG